MKKYLMIIISAALVITACSSDNGDVKKELTEIKKILVEINQKLPSKEADNELIRPSITTPLGGKKLDLNALDKIKLPENPSKNQILKYFREIAQATQNQRSFSESDPQVYMLMEVGHENLEYLVSYNADHMVDMYFTAAIKELAQEEDKELILSYLPRKRDLVKVVVGKRWEEDAKQILISELTELPQYLPTEWVSAVASFDEPCTYDSLKNYLIYGSNRTWTYKAIKNGTSITGLKEAVDEAWKNAKKDHSEWDKFSFAPIAVSYGHVDALEVIISSLDSPSNTPSVYQPRQHIFQYTEFRGSNDKIRKWFKQNKSKLVFDEENEKFIIKQ
ncbi:MAG: hypothetical protein OEM02_17425 [Desulfobulbaceae bacterium]|nr:hypothetical protein [Desulfobulbaceae bacterium]